MRAFISRFLVKIKMRVSFTEGTRKDTIKVQEILHGIELSVLVVPFDNTCNIINFTLYKSNYFCMVRPGN